MILPEPASSVLPHRVDRAAAAWHAFMATGLVMIAALSSLGLFGAPVGAVAGLLVAAVPALAGLALWRPRPPRFVTALAFGWSGFIMAALMLSGGVAGPLAALVLTPLLAGVLFGGARARAIGGAGSVIAVGAGLAAAFAWPAPAAPTLSALILVLVVAGAAWPLLGRLRRPAGRDTNAETTRRLEALLAAQPMLTLGLDASGAVSGVFGALPGGLGARQLATDGLIPGVRDTDRMVVLEALARAELDGEGRAVFAPLEDPDRRLELTARALPEDSLPEGGLIAVVRDVTAALAHEAELVTAREDAENLAAGKSRFLANMSHELRTPLNAVLGFSDMMRQRMLGPLPDRYLEYANLIHEAGGHLLDLINDVLDMSKIEADRYELAREPFDAREPVSASLRLMRLQAHDKGVDLRASLPSRPIEVVADRRALKQMTLNLLSNAVKFTPANGAVTLTLEAVEGVLELSVADTGVGVSRSDIERLGRPYEQAGAADQRVRGTGLGLSLVRSMAELHGGRMTIESTVGEGSVFTIRLPVIEPARTGGEVVPFQRPDRA